jgi:NAD-dependent DNA ligase
MAIIKHYDLTATKLNSILKTSLKRRQEYPIQLPAKVEGSALTYLTLAPYPGQELYVIAAPLRKSLKTRIMVGGHARNDYYHITSHEGKSVDAVKRFLPVKSFLLDTEEPITYKVNANKHCLESENFDLFLHIYRATRLPKQSDDQINKYLLQLYNQSNDAYHQGTGESTISDTSFDQLRKYLISEGLIKKETVGAAPAPTSKKVNLKTPLGSLENAFNQDDLSKFFKKYPATLTMIGTPKIDGISGQINYKDGVLINGNTKGDGYVGEDITRLLKVMPAVPKKLKRPQTIQIRTELFMNNSVFKKKYGKDSGREKPYKNPRNMVAGQKNRDIPDPAIGKDILVLGYSIIGSNKDKSAQLQELKDLGFPVVNWDTFKLSEITKRAPGFLKANRDGHDFDQDGYVVEINDAKYRNDYVGSGINPKFAVAFKADTQTSETEVISISWNISKDKYAKPTAVTKPVELSGATVTSFTLHNAKKVVNLKLGPGAIVKCQRSGDAIPHILETIKPAKVIGLPKEGQWGGWSWNSTGTDIILDKDVQSDEHEIERIKTFFSALNVERFSGGLIEAFYNAGLKTIPDILHVTKASILSTVPRQGNTSAQNIVNEFKKLKDPGVSLPDLMYASGCFGRGLGKNKMYDLYKEYGDNLINGWQGSRLDDIANSIADLHGFSYATGKQFALGIKSYIDFYKSVKDVIYVKPKETTRSGVLSGEVVAFTEFRNKDLATKINELGGTYSDSLTGKTTILLIPRKGVTSTKTAKAKSTVTIMTVDEFKMKYKI